MSGAILVVDDDPDIREVVSLVLELDGYAVIEARDGIEALARLHEAGDIALVVLDLMMPMMDGAEVLAEMRREPALARIPVLVLSGDPDAEKTAHNLGADAWLTKPVTIAVLLGEVGRLLEMARPGAAPCAPPS